ncbi:hypothetical protein T02_8054 [Trichinella nativa]|uniref:Uncharacterized protein n=1 Tax=Trichinella nativa TaxID=6335 RepID=A0A0V1KTH4_9BILA|nr:hypothetical protein T02_8054 [Trichinella nativa]
MEFYYWPNVVGQLSSSSCSLKEKEKCEDQCYLKSRLFEVGRQITMTRCAVKIEKRIFVLPIFGLAYGRSTASFRFCHNYFIQPPTNCLRSGVSQWCDAILLSLTKQIAMLNYQMGCSGVITTLCFVWAIWD